MLLSYQLVDDGEEGDVVIEEGCEQGEADVAVEAAHRRRRFQMEAINRLSDENNRRFGLQNHVRC